MKIHLKRGEKIYINGAVIQVEQRCSIQLLNDVTFLLENHVMQSDMAKTPFEQLYFVLQTMLIDPENEALTRQMYWHLSDNIRQVVDNQKLKDGLERADDLVKAQKYYDALKVLRELFAVEKLILQNNCVDMEFPNLQRAVA